MKVLLIVAFNKHGEIEQSYLFDAAVYEHEIEAVDDLSAFINSGAKVQYQAPSIEAAIVHAIKEKWEIISEYGCVNT